MLNRTWLLLESYSSFISCEYWHRISRPSRDHVDKGDTLGPFEGQGSLQEQRSYRYPSHGCLSSPSTRLRTVAFYTMSESSWLDLVSVVVCVNNCSNSFHFLVFRSRCMPIFWYHVIISLQETGVTLHELQDQALHGLRRSQAMSQRQVT